MGQVVVDTLGFSSNLSAHLLFLSQFDKQLILLLFKAGEFISKLSVDVSLVVQVALEVLVND